jgi:hypothetical protein
MGWLKSKMLQVEQRKRSRAACMITSEVTRCDGAVVRVELPPPWFELQIFRLPGKGGYSTKPPGTTNSLIIWVEVYVASVTGCREVSILWCNNFGFFTFLGITAYH